MIMMDDDSDVYNYDDIDAHKYDDDIEEYTVYWILSSLSVKHTWDVTVNM